ncbi:MAG: TRAP transporter substrate-binding protein [Chloroflexota bacterium]
MKGKRLLTLLFAVMAVTVLVIAGCAPEAAPPDENGNGDVPDNGNGDDNGTPSEPEEEPIRLRMQTPYPTGIVMYDVGQHFADILNEMSGGRFEAEVEPSGAIVDGLKEMRATHEGVLDASLTASHYHTSEVGLVGDLFNLYPAGTNPWEFIVWFYYGGGKELHQEMYDRQDLNIQAGMLYGMTSAESFGWVADPIESLSDFDGMKFRTAGIWGDMLTEVGASVVTMPGGEVYEAAQRGVIDAFEFSTPGVDYSFGFHELGAYLHGPGIHAPQSAMEVLVNKDVWNEMSPELQSIFMNAAQASLVDGWAMTNWKDVEGMRDLTDYGTEFVSLPESVQREVTEIAHDMYRDIAAEDDFFATVYEDQMAFLEEFRDYKDFTQPDPDLMAPE